MSAAMDLKWLPTGTHEVKVGKSLLNGQGGNQRVNKEFYACHFRELPSSCDTTGTLEIRAGSEVGSNRKTARMEREHTNKADMHVFNGVESNTEDTDCVLIYDEETGEISLEKLETMFRFSYEKRVDKPARSPMPPQAPSRSVTGPSLENKKAAPTGRPPPGSLAPPRRPEVEDEPRTKTLETRKPLANDWDELADSADSKPAPAPKPKPRPLKKVPDTAPPKPPPVARPPVLPGSGPAIVLPGMSPSPVLPSMPNQATTSSSKPISTVSTAASDDEWDPVATVAEPPALPPSSLHQISRHFVLEEMDADDMSPQHVPAPLPPTYADPDDMQSQPADDEDDYLADIFGEEDGGDDDDMEEVAPEPQAVPDDDFLAAEMDQDSDEDSEEDSDDD